MAKLAPILVNGNIGAVKGIEPRNYIARHYRAARQSTKAALRYEGLLIT